MQQRGISSFSLLRSDGVGNHDVQTREKIFSWLTEKRPQKACFSPPVIAHQNKSTRCSLRARQIFRQFFEYAAAVLQFWWSHYWEWHATCASWSSVELRDLNAQQKSCGRELFMTACDSCFFAKKTICWKIIVGNSSHPILVSKSTRVSSVKEIAKGKREYPVAMIRRLVYGFVHDLRPPEPHTFLSEADRLLSVSPAFSVASPAQETEDNVSPAERERVRKLIHRLHVAGGHVSKTSLRLLLQRRGCPVWMQHMVDQLQCDSCLETSDAQNAPRVSLATPPKL